jgi:hypothetical protein
LLLRYGFIFLLDHAQARDGELELDFEFGLDAVSICCETGAKRLPTLIVTGGGMMILYE